jgi:hypothetical protein
MSLGSRMWFSDEETQKEACGGERHTDRARRSM